MIRCKMIIELDSYDLAGFIVRNNTKEKVSQLIDDLMMHIDCTELNDRIIEIAKENNNLIGDKEAERQEQRFEKIMIACKKELKW